MHQIAKTKYEWKPNVTFKKVISAQIVGEEIERLRTKFNTQVLETEQLLESARRTKSVLHKLFDWDDSSAAEKHRLSTASQILRSISSTPVYARKVAMPEKTVKRAFVNVVDRDTNTRGYVPRAVAMSDEEKRQQLIGQGWSEIIAWSDKYDDFPEFEEIVNLIESLRPKKKTKAAA